MSSADFQVKKNLQVLGTGSSNVAGSLSVAGALSVGGAASVGGSLVVAGSITSSGNSVLTSANNGAPNGVASLDATGLVPISQLPAGVQPGGNTGNIQYQDASGNFAGSANVNVDANGCLTIGTAVPATPTTSNCALYATSQAGRIIPAFINNAGVGLALQASQASAKVGVWRTTGNATTITADGIAAPTAMGTATTRTVAITNRFTSMRRLGYVSSSTAGNNAGAYCNALQFWRGNAAGLGGFYSVFRFGISDAAAVANARMFVGMYSSASAIGNVQPTSLLNVVGVGCDSAETTLKMIFNDGTSTASTVALGASFPTNTRSTDAYELVLYCPPNASFINYEVTNLTSGANVFGQLTTDLPVNTQLLAPHVWRNNGTTALAVGMDLTIMYIETDY